MTTEAAGLGLTGALAAHCTCDHPIANHVSERPGRCVTHWLDETVAWQSCECRLTRVQAQAAAVRTWLRAALGTVERANPHDVEDTCRCSAWSPGECACGGYVDRAQVRAWEDGYQAALAAAAETLGAE